jgi:nucleotide-binding universal stress UspA family protein
VKKKILWALDPFETSENADSHMVELLTLLSKSNQVTVEPVYVLEFSYTLDSDQVLVRTGLQSYRSSAEKLLQERLKGIENIHFGSPQVLVQQMPSVSEAVQILVDFASAIRAEMIAVSTHGRHGIKRLFLGSFTERLLSFSPIPVLTVSPRVEVKPIRNMLFATDFKESSKKNFDVAVELASNLGANLKVFYATPHTIESIVQSGAYLIGGGWVELPPYVKDADEEKRRMAEDWIQQARSKVSIQYEYDTRSGSVANRIIHPTSGEVEFIVMAAHSGPVTAAVLGSVARQVVRSAPCPVLVLRH